MTTKLKFLALGVALSFALCSESAYASSLGGYQNSVVSTVIGNMSTPSTTNACSQVAAAQTALAQSALQQCDGIAAATYTPPLGVNNASCLGGLMGSMSSTVSNLQSMVSGGKSGGNGITLSFALSVNVN